MVAAALFLSLVAGSALVDRLPLAALALYAGSSAAAFLAYIVDKAAARNGRWRTQEATLHVLALIGGWPGALVAQSLVRHKTRKQPFQVVFWTIVVLNLGVFGWLLWA